ncbi:MAG TPA: aminotransferase class I/II-fold pyridoxal phosphate-dependent enzyme [Ktedonobacterales bacterium]
MTARMTPSEAQTSPPTGPSTNPRLAGQRPNAIFRIGELVHGRSDITHLEFGEPNFPTPAHIIEAARASLASERQTYGPGAGLPWLREALSERVARVNAYAPTPQQIVVAAGGTGALMGTLHALCEAGDEVLVPDPAWPGYDMMIAAIGARKVAYPLNAANGWQPDLDALAAVTTPRAKALVINSPSNPGGAVFPRETVERLVDFAARHNLWLVSDECYDQILFEGEHVSPATLAPERVLTIGTCSKAYAMTGWRVGWVSAPASVAPAITLVNIASVNNLPTFVQRAAYAALTGPQDVVGEMASEYRARRDLAVELVRERYLLEYEPHGAFYLLIPVARACPNPDAFDSSTFDSVAFGEALVRERGIAVGPGEAFGAQTTSYARISLASSREDLRVGITGMLDFAANYVAAK